jgi:dihydroxyacetone kinase
MKSIVNSRDAMVDEMIEGIVLAGCGRLEKIPNIRAMACKTRDNDKVQVVSGGGSGYEPLYSGYIGNGMAAAIAVGNIDAAPSAYSIYETSKYVECGKGVIFVFGNFAGDLLNYDMASELLEQDGIPSRCVIVNDALLGDIECAENRWGIAGIMWAIKIAGGASFLGHSLDDAERISNMAVTHMRTVSMTLEDIENDGMKIHYGKGLSGEPGIGIYPMGPASEIAESVFEWQKTALDLKGGDEICVMVNSYGITSFMETYILYRELHLLTQKNNIEIYDSDVGSFYRSLDSEGCSVTFMKMNDELKACYDITADSPGFKKTRK